MASPKPNPKTFSGAPNPFVNKDGSSSNPFLQSPKQSSPAPSSSGGGGGGGGSSQQNIGTFIDAQTGQGYSGVQKSPFDLPVPGGVQSKPFSGGGGGGGGSSPTSNAPVAPPVVAPPTNEPKKGAYTVNGLNFILPERDIRNLGSKNMAPIIAFQKEQAQRNLDETAIQKANTAFINGQGYSIAQAKQAEFLRNAPKQVSKNTLQKIQETIQKNLEANKFQLPAGAFEEYYRLGNTRRTPEQEARYRELVNLMTKSSRAASNRVANTIVQTAIDTGVSTAALALGLLRHPVETIKALPKQFWEGIKEDYGLLKTDPAVGIARIGTEIVLFKLINKVGKSAYEGAANKLTELNPKFVGKADVGSKLIVKLEDGRTAKINVVARLPRETLENQVRRAGTRINAITSQADSLFKLGRTSRIIEKPIAGEIVPSKLPSAAKALLNRFDKKGVQTLTNAELKYLNLELQKIGSKGLLERSAFFDPASRVRLSRLGIEPVGEAGSFLDYFKQGIRFTKPKPAIYLLDRIKVEKFPIELRPVAAKIARGIPLSSDEANALLRFQLKNSEYAKPVGFVTRESEVTIAPGNILVKKRVVGVTIVRGKRIPIIRVEPVAPKGRLKVLLNKVEKGSVTGREGRELVKLIREKTGIKDYTLSSLKADASRYFSLKRGGLSSVLYASKNAKSNYLPSSNSLSSRSTSSSYIPPRSISPSSGSPRSPQSPRSGSPRSPTSPGPGSPRSPPRSPGRYPPTSPRSGPPRSPPPRYPPRKTPPISPRSVYLARRKPSRRNEPPSFDVYIRPEKTLSGRKTKRFIKINDSPLKQTEAKDLRDYILDTSLSRTGFIKPSRNRPGKPNLRFPRGYDARAGYRFRSFRISRRRRIALPPGVVIEKAQYALNTPQEKQKISLFKRLNQLKITPKKSINRQKPRRNNMNFPGKNIIYVGKGSSLKLHGIEDNRFVKGSRAAKEHMARLRSMRR